MAGRDPIGLLSHPHGSRLLSPSRIIMLVAEQELRDQIELLDSGSYPISLRREMWE